MPEDYKLKRDRGLIELDFGASDSICVTEKTVNLKTNTPEIVGREFFTSTRLDEQIASVNDQMTRQAEPFKAQIENLTALRDDIAKKEAERTALEQKAVGRADNGQEVPA